MKRFQLSLWVCLVVCFGFSTYAQDTKEIIILQTSDVHSRIEPINQKATVTMTRAVLSVVPLSSTSSARNIKMCCCSTAGIFHKVRLIIICSVAKWKSS